MLNFVLNQTIIREFFPDSTFQRGWVYFKQGRVSKVSFDPAQSTFFAKVNDSQIYSVAITIKDHDHQLNIDNTCSCPLGGDCKHVVAALLHFAEQSLTPAIIDKTATPDKNKLSKEVEEWLHQLDHALQPQTETKNSYPADVFDRLIYLLDIEKTAQNLQLKVELVVVRELKKSGYGAAKKFNFNSSLDRRYILPEDKAICALLKLMPKNHATWYESIFYLQNQQGDELLQRLLATKRCHWQSSQTPALSLGDPRHATLNWIAESTGLQRLQCQFTAGQYPVIALSELWYVDSDLKLCGKVIADLPVNLTTVLLRAPPIKPLQVKRLYESLTKSIQQHAAPLPLPKKFSQKMTEQVAPQPCLNLLSISVKTQPDYSWRSEIDDLLVAKLVFQYKKSAIDYGADEHFATEVVGDQLMTYARQIALEEKYVEALKNKGLVLLSSSASQIKITKIDYQYYFVFPNQLNIDQEKLHMRFCSQTVPELRRAGWTITFSSDYPCNVIEEIDEWYTRIEESHSDWFNLELGISINGETINLLPVILKLLQSLHLEDGPDALMRLHAKKPLMVHLPQGGLLPIPTERLRQILNILTELYDDNPLKDGQLKLSRLRAGQLNDLEAATASKMRWLGGDNVRALGNQLRDFRGIKSVRSPHNFQAQLRPYQQEGLNWLQFLREYQLAGILADDMGLGKTVQALAHLLVEKNQQRMDKPSLVIAPTSLMTNWRLEAERFAPSLKILTLHGADRKPHFEKITGYDVVLTTYPLVVRDKEALLAIDYHLLILDEAQVIKNPKAQATQIVQQINARHRLCLTGTPMENHLGELWSLFHFLLPGLLGEASQFNRLFRFPIEKRHDVERRANLIKRIAPFILRRTKQEVVQELPAKTEIIRTIELAGAQRDLYESIRIAMQQKVSQAIHAKGLANSHIIVLDALLKLRQTCCDPRLLKLDAAKKAEVESAKLEFLRDILPEMVEEGRRILLFSQFAEMLKLIEKEVIELKINYVKLTGQTVDRATPIQTFQTGNAPLFLISLKAGGTGLNLTAADTVIHYDPWWNPAVENQATDRAHRIGQDKAVFVYKLITQGTVEEKILSMQHRKQALLDSIFSEQTETKAKLSLEDLDELFRPL